MPSTTFHDEPRVEQLAKGVSPHLSLIKRLKPCVLEDARENVSSCHVCLQFGNSWSFHSNLDHPIYKKKR